MYNHSQLFLLYNVTNDRYKYKLDCSLSRVNWKRSESFGRCVYRLKILQSCHCDSVMRVVTFWCRPSAGSSVVLYTLYSSHGHLSAEKLSFKKNENHPKQAIKLSRVALVLTHMKAKFEKKVTRAMASFIFVELIEIINGSILFGDSSNISLHWPRTSKSSRP